jgi:hypothetical protein
LSPLAHNGYLQVLSDGGLLLGVPFLLVTFAVAWWVVAALLAAVRHRDASLPGMVVPLSLGALLVHSAVDFDWSYAADFLVVAVLTGILAGHRWSTASQIRSGPVPRALTGAIVAGVVLLGLAAGTAWSGDLRLSLPTSPAVSSGSVR